MRLSEYAKQMGVSYRTAFRWWQAGKLDAYQLDTGTIIVREPKEQQAPTGVALYARVSTTGQKEDLERQVQRLKDYAAAKGYRVTKVVQEIASGMNDARPKLMSRLTAVKRANRRHSRCKKGSSNRKKAQRRFAKLHRRIAHIRQDALHKATSSLVAKTKPPEDRPSVIVLEDLNVSGMLKNHKLARAIADVGMYELKRQLTYKAAYAGIEVKEVSRWYPSSKTCSSCGTVREELSLAERVFVCLDCGYVADRDYNAAQVLAGSA